MTSVGLTAEEYEAAIIQAFRDLCERPIGGTSAHDVAGLLRQRNQMAPGDTPVEINGIMRRLQKEGRL